MYSNNHAKPVDGSVLPQEDVALRQFEDLGGRITTFSPFGEDPLRHSVQLANQRETEFKEHYPDFSCFFHRIVNGDNSLFREGLLFLIGVSKHLESLI